MPAPVPPGRFVPSLELNAAFYREAVLPLLADRTHSAALLGWGSDILGYDTARSTDHGWGPRLLLFVPDRDVAAVTAAIDAGLPAEFGGWPTRYGWDAVPVQHHVTVITLGSWLEDRLGFDPRQGMETIDWLLTPQQALLEVVRGAVYHDGLGELGALREALRWYPDEVWLWLVACQWRRISQEEAFVGRAAEVGDEIGSRIVAARMVREVMRLAFLLARDYWAYSKWFGTAFSRLADDDGLGAALMGAVAAANRAAREAALAVAYETVASRHNQAAITPFIDPEPRLFYGRPYRVLMADRFGDACLDAVKDPWLRSLPLVGSVDQAADSTDVLPVARRLRDLYQPK